MTLTASYCEKTLDTLSESHHPITRSDILQALPNVSEEEACELFPNKCQVTIIKLANRTLVYAVDGIPLFFDHLGQIFFHTHPYDS